MKLPACPNCHYWKVRIHPEHSGWWRCDRCDFPFLRLAYLKEIKGGIVSGKYTYKGDLK